MLAGPSQMPSLRTVIALRVKPRIENVEGAAGLSPEVTPGKLFTASAILLYPRARIKLELTSSIDAGVSITVNPRRLPALEMDSRSSVLMARPGTTISFITSSY